MLADPSLDDARAELRRFGRGLRRPVRGAIARAIKAGDLSSALPVLAHYRDANPDDANDSARYLADHTPVLFAMFGDVLTSEDTRELRVATKSFVVEIAAGALISLGAIVGAAIARDTPADNRPPPTLSVPSIHHTQPGAAPARARPALCQGHIETMVGPEGDRRLAKIPSLVRCPKAPE
jgi:hypothetical protein